MDDDYVVMDGDFCDCCGVMLNHENVDPEDDCVWVDEYTKVALCEDCHEDSDLYDYCDRCGEMWKKECLYVPLCSAYGYWEHVCCRCIDLMDVPEGAFELRRNL